MFRMGYNLSRTRQVCIISIESSIPVYLVCLYLWSSIIINSTIFTTVMVRGLFNKEIICGNMCRQISGGNYQGTKVTCLISSLQLLTFMQNLACYQLPATFLKCIVKFNSLSQKIYYEPLQVYKSYRVLQDVI